jgi:hypothetical protein
MKYIYIKKRVNTTLFFDQIRISCVFYAFTLNRAFEYIFARLIRFNF